MMKKKDFYHFLDQPDRRPSDQEEREWFALYREVENLEQSDPGEEYWRQFNHRLQERIDRLPSRSGLRRWWVFPSWIAAAATLAIAGFFLFPGKSSTSLDGLDSESLSLIEQVYGVEEAEPAPHIAEGDIEALLQAFEPLLEDPLPEEGFVPISPEKFKALWNLEG